MRFGVEKIILAILCTIVVLACFWLFIGLRYDLWTPTAYSRYHWLCSRMKIAPEFWHGRIKAGDDARKIVKAWPPQVIHQFGPWAELEWIPFNPDKKSAVPDIGIVAVAENAKLVLARSYARDGIDEKTFFDALTPSAQAQYQAALEMYTWGELSGQIRPSNSTRKTAGKPRTHK
ncbi:MAG TPA: hypothetical protein VGN23_07360 [Verrucomicrobiae bacterium]|jgi:hypothetical protein